MGYSNKRWYGSRGRPPFYEGDMVTPKYGVHGYATKQHVQWRNGEYRRVEVVRYDQLTDSWTLGVFNPAVNRISYYTPVNFTTDPIYQVTNKEAVTMEMKRTKFFGIKLILGSYDSLAGSPDYRPEGSICSLGELNGGMAENGGFRIDDVNKDHDNDDNHYDTTQLRNSQHEVRCDISKVIKHGERWIVCQTVCMIEGEEPRPPIRVTEFR